MQSQSGSSTVKVKLGNYIIVGYCCALVGRKCCLTEIILPVRECNKVFGLCMAMFCRARGKIRNAFRIAPGFFVSL